MVVHSNFLVLGERLPFPANFLINSPLRQFGHLMLVFSNFLLDKLSRKSLHGPIVNSNFLALLQHNCLYYCWGRSQAMDLILLIYKTRFQSEFQLALQCFFLGKFL